MKVSNKFKFILILAVLLIAMLACDENENGVYIAPEYAAELTATEEAKPTKEANNDLVDMLQDAGENQRLKDFLNDVIDFNARQECVNRGYGKGRCSVYLCLQGDNDFINALGDNISCSDIYNLYEQEYEELTND
jgi:hypothetical protein